MRRRHSIVVSGFTTLALAGVPVYAQGGNAAADSANDPVRQLVERLDLEKYKATIKGLTQFGDRRQGTKRNRDALDWIEAQLKSYGCTNTERITYTYTTPQRGGGRGATTDDPGGTAAGRGEARGAGQAGAAGQTGAAGQQPAAAQGQRGRGQGAGGGQRGRGGQGGSAIFGNRARTGVNN